MWPRSGQMALNAETTGVTEVGVLGLHAHPRRLTKCGICELDPISPSGSQREADSLGAMGAAVTWWYILAPKAPCPQHVLCQP